MIVSVASGKGGTGKTTIASSLALSLKNVQFIDCDVEEPNAQIFLKPDIKEKTKAFISVPRVDNTKCTLCGKCKEVCEYNAIAVLPKSQRGDGKVLIFQELCHGCGACAMLCPEQAITEVDREIGEIEAGSKDSLDFVHGRLNIGEAMSPPLIRQVKKHINPSKTVIIDAPPGTSCPVITAVKGSDYCILVTEPTPFGLNDLVLAVGGLRKLAIPFGVIINRSDLGNDKTEKYCASEKINVLMRVPFKKEIALAYSKGVPMAEIMPELKEEFKKVFKIICGTVDGENHKQ